MDSGIHLVAKACYLCFFTEQHAALIERAKVLGSDAVRVAAGWVLKGASGVLGAYNMSLGLLGLLDSSGKYTDKVLQLRYLSAEALSFLTSTLDLAYLLIHLPPQKKGDINTLRFCKENCFKVRKREQLCVGLEISLSMALCVVHQLSMLHTRHQLQLKHNQNP